MLGVWSYLRQFMYTKFVIVTDDDIDARDWQDVIWAISTRVDPHARPHHPRAHADRLSRLRLAEIRPRLEARDRRHRQVAARDQARLGHQDTHERGDHRAGHRTLGRLRPPRLRPADLEIPTGLGGAVSYQLSRPECSFRFVCAAGRSRRVHSLFPIKAGGACTVTRALLSQTAGQLILATWLVASASAAQDIPPAGRDGPSPNGGRGRKFARGGLPISTRAKGSPTRSTRESRTGGATNGSSVPISSRRFSSGSLTEAPSRSRGCALSALGFRGLWTWRMGAWTASSGLTNADSRGRHA